MQRERSLGASWTAAELIGVAVFLVCELYVALRAPLMAAAIAVQALLLALLCWLAFRFTGETSNKKVAAGILPLVQVAWCIAVLAAAALRGNFTSSRASGGLAPTWVMLHHVVFERLTRITPADFALGIVNFIDYALLAGVVLFLLGVRPGDMGLGRFRRGAARSALCWFALPLGAATLLAGLGRAAPATLLRAFAGNFLQNGFSEEFLFRGALLGRLRALWGTRIALLAQAVLFGLWHLDNDLSQAHGALPLAIALALANHAVMGYALGFVTVRTGNIAIASVFHALLDTVFG